MAITLSGIVANAADNTTNWNGGSLSAEPDIKIEGTNSLADKVSQTSILFYNLGSLTGSPWAASGGQTHEEYGFAFWINCTTPMPELYLVASSGASATGVWGNTPNNYTGGFLPKVATFKRPVNSGVQQTYIDMLGVRPTVNVKVQGNIDNFFLDQVTVFRGLIVDGTANTFEGIRSADQDTNIWGIMTAQAGSFIVKGGLYLGPVTGDAASSFSDEAAVIVWGDEAVHSGFYDINIRGTGTTVDFDSCLFRQEASGNTYTKWNLTVDGSNVPVFSDLNSIFQGSDVITLQSTSSLSGTKLERGGRLIQNSGILDLCDIVNADTGDGEAYILSDYPDRISNSEFTFSSGHAIEFTPTASGKSINFTGNTFTSYPGTGGTNSTPNSGPTNAAIYNNSSGDITLNILGGGTSPSVRNGPGATTTVVAAVSLTLGGIVANATASESSEVRIYTAGTTTELDGIEGVVPTGNGLGSFTFSFEQGDPNVDIRIFNVDYRPVDLLNFELPDSDTTIPIQQIFDRNYDNP